MLPNTHICSAWGEVAEGDIHSSWWSWRGLKFLLERYCHGGEKYSLAFSMAAPVLASSAIYCQLGEVLCPIEASVSHI